MRLWHQDMISIMPRQQLLGQHREVCALRGNGWGKPHSVVNYVFNYSMDRLYAYHIEVMEEMKKRGYKVDVLWYDPNYRGKICPPRTDAKIIKYNGIIYPEHNDLYLHLCLENINEKLALQGIKIEMRG